VNRFDDEEAPLDPARPIVDPHHHLWDFPPAADRPTMWIEPFLLPDLLSTIGASGHNVTHTVFVDCGFMYRQDGPEAMRPIGETEAVNGVAAMAASGRYGPCRVAAGIVRSADLMLGERVAPILEAHIAAGNGRFRGVRTHVIHSGIGMYGLPPDPGGEGIMLDPAFREGVRALGRLGLSYDLYCAHRQLDEAVALAAACPDTLIVLDHMSTPQSMFAARFADSEEFGAWRDGHVALAERANVVVKLGGLGVNFCEVVGHLGPDYSSAELAPRWAPYIETCIELYGPDRCMFESNFPPDRAKASYGAVWNTFKRIVAEYSEAEKTALFSGTAMRAYRLD
jgi:predicted TIM-barrel fold metal-dependent hydrolase